MERAETAGFGELLKSYRTRLRKTQQQLAECLEVTRGTVIAWEQGAALPKDRARIEEVRRCLDGKTCPSMPKVVQVDNE